jgi:predicted DNA-binding antitoxin AbrB/MazE fold protein
MKKVFLAFAALLTAHFTYAQSGIGIKGGVNLSNVYTDAGSFKNNINQSLDTKTGWVFGVWGRLGNRFYLQPELLASTKGGKVVFTPSGSGASPTIVDVKTTYLDIPVLVGFKPVKFIRLMAGPVASIKLREDEKLLEAIKTYSNDTDEAFEKMSYGYQLGVGIKVLGLELDLRKEGSLTDVSSIKFNNNEKFNQRLNGWQFTVGFKIL